ncbi:MAG: hypothetical protein KAR20_03475 [Candidatus Heimdallarchaeota archaeon]|nr:hypothetical protein [Candidatus Heimdallarchaeota archaeon]
MDEVKEVFSHLWDKAAYQCKILKDEIEKRYPFLIVLPGHGALDAKEHDSKDELPGAPDLYVWHNQKLVCAIEVTGSDKVIPWDIWLGKHKVEFARNAEYPIGFFLFFGKDNQLRLFASMEELDSVIEHPEVKNIRGLNFEYHVVDRIFFKGEVGFWNWFQNMLEIRLGVVQ